MSLTPKTSFGRRAKVYLAIFVAAVLFYYGAEILMRTPPLTPLQHIAHRGGAHYAPENTLAAFRNSIAQKADYLELDVQMTKDGALVVIHDETVDRTTNGTGAVRNLTLKQIRELNAGQGEKTPTFEEVIELAKKAGIKILAEAKSPRLYPGLEEKMLQTLEKADYIDRTIIQSFDEYSVNKFHRLNHKAKLCDLHAFWHPGIGAPPSDAQYLCPMAEIAFLNPWIIRQAHEEGRQVFVWFGTIENSFMMNVLRFFGVDGLILDDPLVFNKQENKKELHDQFFITPIL
jgi:glycerophosphoryl diester phosphodiesterase